MTVHNQMKRISFAVGGMALLVNVGCQSTGTQQIVRDPLTRKPLVVEQSAETRVNASTYFAYGHLLERQGHVDRAVEQYRKALQMQPSFAAAHNRLGICYNKQGEHEQATREFELCVRSSPDDAQAMNNLGYSLYLQGQYKAAASVLRKALDARPDFTRARMNLALALARQEQMQAAYDEFSRACSPADAHYNLGLMQIEVGRYADATRSLEAAVVADPEHALARAQLRELGRLTGEGTEAPVPNNVYASTGAGPAMAPLAAAPQTSPPPAPQATTPALNAPTPRATVSTMQPAPMTPITPAKAMPAPTPAPAPAQAAVPPPKPATIPATVPAPVPAPAPVPPKVATRTPAEPAMPKTPEPLPEPRPESNEVRAMSFEPQPAHANPNDAAATGEQAQDAADAATAPPVQSPRALPPRMGLMTPVPSNDRRQEPADAALTTPVLATNSEPGATRPVPAMGVMTPVAPDGATTARTAPLPTAPAIGGSTTAEVPGAITLTSDVATQTAIRQPTNTSAGTSRVTTTPIGTMTPVYSQSPNRGAAGATPGLQPAPRTTPPPSSPMPPAPAPASTEEDCDAGPATAAVPSMQPVEF